MKQYLHLQSVIKNMTATAIVSVLTLASLGNGTQIGLLLFAATLLKETTASMNTVTGTGIVLTTHSFLKHYLHLQSVVKNVTATGTISILTLASLGDASQIIIICCRILKEAMASYANVTVTAFS
jgi:hypothetical protein